MKAKSIFITILFSLIIILASCTSNNVEVKLAKEQPTFDINVKEFDLSSYAFPRETNWNNEYGHADLSMNTKATIPYKPEILYEIKVNDRIHPNKIRVLKDKILVASKSAVYAYSLNEGKKLYEACIVKFNCNSKESPIFAYRWDPVWDSPGFYTDEKTNTFFILAPLSHGTGDLGIKVFDAETGKVLTREVLLVDAGTKQRLKKAEVEDGILVLLYRDFVQDKYVIKAYALPKVNEIWSQEFKGSDVENLDLRMWISDGRVLFVPKKNKIFAFSLEDGKKLYEVDKGEEASFSLPSWKVAGNKMVTVEPYGSYRRLPVIFDIEKGTLEEGTSLEGYGNYAWDLATITPQATYHVSVKGDIIEGFDLKNNKRFVFGQGNLGYAQGYKQAIATSDEYVVFTEVDPASKGKDTGQFVVGVADLNTKEIKYLEKFEGTWQSGSELGLTDSWAAIGDNKILVGVGSDYPIIYVLGDKTSPAVELKEVQLVNGTIILEGKVADSQSKVDKVVLLVKYQADENSEIKKETFDQDLSKEGYFKFELPALPGSYKVVAVAYDHANNLGVSESQGFKIIKV